MLGVHVLTQFILLPSDDTSKRCVRHPEQKDNKCVRKTPSGGRLKCNTSAPINGNISVGCAILH